MRRIDIPPQTRFGRLTTTGLFRDRLWECVCDCGATTMVSGYNLRRGVQSCRPCAVRENRVTHGNARRGKASKAYRVWRSMRARCEKPNSPSYKYYGAKGITVCERWMSFESFLADMGEPPSGHTIDRADSTDNYHPGNCRWATPSQQNRNKSDTRMVFLNGSMVPLITAAEEKGLPYSAVVQRVRKLGWTPERALSQPLRVMPQRTR